MINESEDLSIADLEVAISATFLGFVNLGIVVENCLVLLIVWRTAKLHKPNYYLLCSLSVADLLVGLFYCPLLIVSVVQRSWKLGNILCDIHAVTICISLNASLMSLCAIAVDRFYFITKPLSYKGIVTTRRAVVSIAFVWLHSVFWAVVPLAGWGEYVFEDSTNTCKPNWRGVGLDHKSYALCLAVVCFLLPVLVMISAYSIIYTTARKQLKRIQIPGESNEEVRRSLAKNHKASQTVLIIIGMFFLCWSVYTTVSLWKLFASLNELPVRLVRIGIYLAVANSCVNFYVYAVRDRVFRNGLWKILNSLRGYEHTIHPNLSRFGATPVPSMQIDSFPATLDNISKYINFQTSL